MIDYNDFNEWKEAPDKVKRSNKKTRIKKQGKLPEGCQKGLVVASIGRMYLVETDDLELSILPCFLAGIVISQNENESIVAVGDYVHYKVDEYSDKAEINGTIYGVEKRESFLNRAAPGKKLRELVIASNIEKLLIIVAAQKPRFNTRLIDRYLVSAELGGIKAAICINKIDLDDIALLEEELYFYKELGIDIFYISAENNTNIDSINDFLRDSKVVLSGPSGVGKSTLINALLGSYEQEVGEVSEKYNKGCHTTSFVKMFDIPEINSRIIDTPGIREFGIYGIDKQELALYFHEFDDYRENCKYYTCSHIHEPGCEVIEALEEGKISIERYESYINLYDTLKD